MVTKAVTWLLIIAVMVSLYAPIAAYVGFDWVAWLTDAQQIEEFNLASELQYAFHFELVEGNNPLQDSVIDWLLEKFPIAAVAQSFARVYLAGKAVVYYVTWIVRSARFLSPWDYFVNISPVSWTDNEDFADNNHETHGGGSGHQGGR